MDYQHGDSQAQQPLSPSSSWLAQATSGQQQIDYLNVVAHSPVPEFHRSAIFAPILYHGVYYYPSATADPNIYLNQPNGVDRQDIPQLAQHPFVVAQNNLTLLANHHTPFQPQLSYAYPQQHVEHVVAAPPATISPSLTISNGMAPQSPIVRPSFIRSDLSMTAITSNAIRTPTCEQASHSLSDSSRRTYDLLAETEAFLRNSPNQDPTVGDQYPFPSLDMTPLEYPSLDARRLSVDSDTTYISHFSESSNSSVAAAARDDVTLVESPCPGNLTTIYLPGSVCESPGDAGCVSPATLVQASEVDIPAAPSIFRSQSPPPCVLNRRSMTPAPAPPAMPVVPHVLATPPRAGRTSLAVVVEGMVSRMHSEAPVPPPSQVAEKEDLPAKDKHEGEAPATTVPRASTSAAKKEILDSEEIDQIVNEWAPAPDPAGVAKTRRRKQTSALATMSSHRMPSHFKKRSRAPRKTSSYTPSKTPSPPPSSFVDTRSPSPFIPIPPPPVTEPTAPSLPPPVINKKSSVPLRAKPAQPRRSRVIKPAAVPRASPAHHPATGRPSKACLFCRRRKIGCTQSETSRDSCQQCIDRHLTCEYPPDVQLAALAHASSSSSSLVSRRTRREIKREST